MFLTSQIKLKPKSKKKTANIISSRVKSAVLSVGVGNTYVLTYLVD